MKLDREQEVPTQRSLPQFFGSGFDPSPQFLLSASAGSNLSHTLPLLEVMAFVAKPDLIFLFAKEEVHADIQTKLSDCADFDSM